MFLISSAKFLVSYQKSLRGSLKFLGNSRNGNFKLPGKLPELPVTFSELPQFPELPDYILELSEQCPELAQTS